MNVTLGEFVSISRKRLKISQDDLAKKAGIHRNTLSAFENGDMNITLGSLQKIFNAIGYSLDIEMNTKPELK